MKENFIIYTIHQILSDMSRKCSTHGRKKDKILVGKLEWKRPRRPSYRFDDNIKINLKETGCDNSNSVFGLEKLDL
jgi:hypothetical protein